MRSGNTTPLCAIEDWSGAGFHTKQPLNVGQPTVSQVVSSPNNQSCLDPNSSLGQASIPKGSAERVRPWTSARGRVGASGRNGKQASASKILLSWARGPLGRRRRPQGSPSRRRTSESPVEFSFPPDADSRGLSIGKSFWWCMPFAQQGSVVSTLMAVPIKVAYERRVAVTGSNEQPAGYSCLRTLVSVLHHRSRSPRLDVACPRTKCS